VTAVIVMPESFEGNDSAVSQWVGAVCKQTSYNTYGGVHFDPRNPSVVKPPLRKNYAGIGYTYDPARDAFIPPKPQSQALLNDATCLWEVLENGAG